MFLLHWCRYSSVFWKELRFGRTSPARTDRYVHTWRIRMRNTEHMRIDYRTPDLRGIVLDERSPGRDSCRCMHTVGKHIVLPDRHFHHDRDLGERIQIPVLEAPRSEIGNYNTDELNRWAGCGIFGNGFLAFAAYIAVSFFASSGTSLAAAQIPVLIILLGLPVAFSKNLDFWNWDGPSRPVPIYYNIINNVICTWHGIRNPLRIVSGCRWKALFFSFGCHRRMLRTALFHAIVSYEKYILFNQFLWIS